MILFIIVITECEYKIYVYIFRFKMFILFFVHLQKNVSYL